MKTNGDSTATRDILKGEVSPAQFATLWGQHKAIYPEHEGTLLDTLLKKAVSDANKTNQGLEIGEIDHPFDLQAAIDFKSANPHHSRCIDALVNATVGLGFDVESLHESLDPLCPTSIQDLLTEVGEDYYHTDVAYIEVVSKGDTITGLHHIPAQQVNVIVENDNIHKHYIIRSASGMYPEVIFAEFGDKQGLVQRASESETSEGGSMAAGFVVLPKNLAGTDLDPDDISEIIQIRKPNSQSKWYGFPGWLSGVAFIELVQMFVQEKFDFYLNRGVPEFMLFFLGGMKIDPQTWSKIEQAMLATMGQGNQHKSIAIDLPEIGDKKVELFKLAMEAKGEGNEISKTLDALSLAIVSAHGVPALLAGIQIPGKLGATNELPNALRAFQLLTIGPRQRTVAAVLANTLGIDRRLPNVSKEDFLPSKRPKSDDPMAPDRTDRSTGFKKITDEMDMDLMDTSARMRQTEPEAAAEGRDMSQGLKD